MIRDRGEWLEGLARGGRGREDRPVEERARKASLQLADRAVFALKSVFGLKAAAVVARDGNNVGGVRDRRAALTFLTVAVEDAERRAEDERREEKARQRPRERRASRV